MSKNKYLEIYDDIFPGNGDNNELKIKKSYNLFNDNTSEINFIKESIINLIDAEYVIFPTNKFYHYSPLGNGFAYLKKTKTICINYYLRYILIQKLNVINELIKSENKKYSKIKSNMIKLLKKENLKPIYFLENEILPNTLYRKIKFGQEEVFMSFNIYAYKRIEYKLKTLCQLVEKMGATKIEIKYSNDSEIKKNLEMGLTGLDNNIGGKITNETEKKREFSTILNFNETNQINNINLNIYDLEKIIEKENEFYISKEQFESDIDIKFLLNARCVNLVEKYNTKLVFEYMNKFEHQLKIKAQKFGLTLDFSFDENSKEELYIDVNFLDPFKYLDCINGYNISPYSSGYNHLSKLIKKIEFIYHKDRIDKNKKDNSDINSVNSDSNYISEETKTNEHIISTINCNKAEKELYLMVNYFLESHLKLLNEKKKLLDIIYNTNIDLTKAYSHIINTNFTSEQIQSLFYYFFRDNLSYKSFEKFRNILIKPLNNILEFFVKSNYFNVKINNKNKYNFYDNILASHKKFETKSYAYVPQNVETDSVNNDNKPDECLKLINIEKMVFISYQYHNILDYRLKIMDMLDETLEKIKIKLIKTCDILKNLIYKESEEWEYIFKTMEKIKYGNNKKIYKLKKKFNIDYDINYKNYWCMKIPLKPDPRGIELRKYYEECKKEYDKVQKPEDTIDDISCIAHYLCSFNNCKKNLINYNKQDIQGLIKKYMSKSLLDISNLVKNKVLKNYTSKNLSCIISELIPDKKKFLSEYTDFQKNIPNINVFEGLESCKILKSSLQKQDSMNNIYLEPKLYISPNRINKNVFDADDFLLQMLCFLMESYYEDDDLNIKYNLKDNFNKIQSKIKYNFELISSEIKNTFNKFFYKENGFFSKDEYDNLTLKNELIALYANNKVSDIDEKVILVFNLLFEPNYLNFSKLSSIQSVFNNMYNLLSDIMKNYENNKLIPEATDLKYIKENFPLSKLILTYQRYKIFFTYEDFANYFNTSYNNEIIDEYNYPFVDNFISNLSKINNTTFNKIYKTFKCESNIEENYKNLELEIQKDSITINKHIILSFIEIYKTFKSNPKIHNLLNKTFDDYKNNITENIIYLKHLTEKIELNPLFIKFKNIINDKNKNDKNYFENLMEFFKNNNLPKEFEGKEYLEEILEKNYEYTERLTQMIYNLIMNKYNIIYNDLNNENYDEYINKIKNELLPPNMKSFYMKQINKSIEKNNEFVDYNTINNLNETNNKDNDENKENDNNSNKSQNDKENDDNLNKSQDDEVNNLIELSNKESNNDKFFINKKFDSLNSLISDDLIEDSSAENSSVDSEEIKKNVGATIDA